MANCIMIFEDVKENLIKYWPKLLRWEIRTTMFYSMLNLAYEFSPKPEFYTTRYN